MPLLLGFGSEFRSREDARLLCRTVAPSGTVYTWSQIREATARPLVGPPIRFDICRHGESVANSQRKVAGRMDVELTGRGWLQAVLLGLRLGGQYDHAWTSSLTRSKTTLSLARLVRPRLARACYVHTDARIDERALGLSEGGPRRQVPQYARGDIFFAPAGGESYLDLTQRVVSFLIDVRRALPEGGNVVLSTHAGPMRVLAGILERITDAKTILNLSFENSSIYRSVLTELSWPAFVPVDQAEVRNIG